VVGHLSWVDGLLSQVHGNDIDVTTKTSYVSDGYLMDIYLIVSAIPRVVLVT